MWDRDAPIQALARRGIDAIITLLNHFHDGGTWESWRVGSNAAYLEQVKLDLVALANEVENRLTTLYASSENIDKG